MSVEEIRQEETEGVIAEFYEMLKPSPRIMDVFFEHFPTKPIKINKTNMSKEQKRDSNGRFTKKSPKVEVKVNVEPKPEKDLSDLVCISRGEWEQLKLERDAFKETAERFMGKYLTACAEKKAAEEKRLYVLDALRLAYIYLGWFRSKLSWWTKKKYQHKILDMDMELDRFLVKAEGMDRD